MYLLQLTQNNQALVLHGPGAAAPFRAALYHPDKEALEIILEGAPGQIDSGVSTLARLAAEARRTAGLPGRDSVYLEAQVTPSGGAWRTRLLDGALSLPASVPFGRATGSQGLRLALTREPWWEGAETAAPLSNGSAARVTTGLTIANHWDSGPGHQNYADLAAPDALGELPAPLRLEFRALEGGIPGTLYAGQNVFAAPEETQAVYEGEHGLPGSATLGAVTADPTCSGGQYQHLSWSGSADTLVWRVGLAPDVLARYAGRAFLPTLRLAGSVDPAESLWHYWRLSLTWTVTETLLDGPGSYLTPPAYLYPGAPLCLPPWPAAPGDAPSGLNLDLRVQAGEGSHVLDIDYLYLLPLDGWRIYRPLVQSWGGGLWIVDDPAGGTLSAGEWAIQTHACEGPGLCVYPGRLNRYYFLVENTAGGFLPDRQSSVSITYRPRKAAL